MDAHNIYLYIERERVCVCVIFRPKYMINYGDYIINIIFKVFEFSYYYMGVCKMIFPFVKPIN